MKRGFSTEETLATLDGLAQAGLVRACAKRKRLLIKAVGERFCRVFAPGGTVIYITGRHHKFVHLKPEALASFGVVRDAATRIPDVIIHYAKKNRLFLIEAVTSVSERSKPARKERMKTGHFEGSIALSAVSTAHGRDE